MHHQARRMIAAGTILAGWLALAGQPAQAAIMINEVLFNPGGNDVNGDGIISASGDEFVELINTDAAPVSLNGWRLKDALATRHAFGPTSLVPGLGFLVIFGSGASTGTLALNNTGDTVSLLNPSLTLIDQLVYSQLLSGVSLTRSPDGMGPFVNHHTVSELAFSPGMTTAGARQLAVPDDGISDGSSPVVPEPATWWLFGVGPLALAAARRGRLRIG